VAYTLSDEMKITDVGWPWRSLTTSTFGYPSDSSASCFSQLLLLLCASFIHSLTFSFSFNL